MRITNGIMINNNLYNINKNKTSLDNIMTQIDTTKKIQRPSEDPITAIRALRLRSTYNEIVQYKDRNVEDAEAWMDVTADALSKINEVLENIVYYCNQGVNEYQTIDEYDAIIADLKQYREAVYQDGNADYGDRTIFTGYKTDETLTFLANDPDISYSITQNFSGDEIETLKRLVGVNQDDILTAAHDYVGTDIVNTDMHVIKLAYDGIDVGNFSLTSADGQTFNVMVLNESYDMYGIVNSSAANKDSVFYVPSTGELIFGDTAYDRIVNSDFTVTYSKTGFETGDLKPEHYFDCTKTEIVGTETKVTTYTAKTQNIDYTVSFNQTLTINVEAQDVLKHDIGRDVDEIIQRLEDMRNSIQKLEDIEKQISVTTDENKLKVLEHMKSAAELEQQYALSNLSDSFADGIKNFKGHQETVSVTISDLAARMSRLSLIKDRLEQQALTVEELKSKNEDTDLAMAAVEYQAMDDVYSASLATAAKVVQMSLLDFL